MFAKKHRSAVLTAVFAAFALLWAAACAAAQEPGKAHVVVSASASWEPFLQEVIERFEARYPHIDVEWRVRLNLADHADICGRRPRHLRRERRRPAHPG